MGTSKDLKGVSIVEQIRLALKFLNGYPGIEDVIDVKAARGFLEMLEGTEARYIPKFSVITKKKIQKIKKKLEGNLVEWMNALKSLPFTEVIGPYEGEEDGSGREVLFDCRFPIEVDEIPGDTERNGGCAFIVGNRAFLGGVLWNTGIKELEAEVSWAEAYERIANHLNHLASKPSIPPFPKEFKKK